jgi:hypothetical protein
MKRKTILFTLLLLLLLAHGAQAMSSTNFALDWFTPLTSNGGGPSHSTNYAANFTIGQTVIGASSSTNYSMSLGYWYGLFQQFLLRLPIINKP